MKDVLTYLLEAIVLDPKAVSIEEKEDEEERIFYITCGKDDMGRVIGKKGKIIKALRKVLAIRGLKEGKRITITMVDDAS